MTTLNLTLNVLRLTVVELLDKLLVVIKTVID